MTLRELELKLKTLLDSTIDRQLMDTIGDHTSLVVKERTRRGYGVAKNEGPKKRLKGISESTKKRRKGLAAQGQLSSETSPNKSNLTRTGKMLDDIAYRAKANEVLIYLKGNSSTKAKKNADLGRIFMNLSKSEISIITKIVEEEIKKGINKKGL